MDDQPVGHEDEETVGEAMDRVERQPRGREADDGDDRARDPPFVGEQQRPGRDPGDDDHGRDREEHDQDRSGSPKQVADLVPVGDPVDEPVAHPGQVDRHEGGDGRDEADRDHRGRDVGAVGVDVDRGPHGGGDPARYAEAGDGERDRAGHGDREED